MNNKTIKSLKTIDKIAKTACATIAVASGVLIIAGIVGLWKCRG